MPQRYNTDNPVPSNAMMDLNDNAIVFDEFVNNFFGNTVTRKGVIVPVLQEQVKTRIDGLLEDAIDAVSSAQNSALSAQAAAAEAQSISDGGTTFATTAEGIVATTSGQYFRIPQGTGSEISFIYYLNNAGTALAVAQQVGQAAIEDVKSQLKTVDNKPTMVPLVVDEDDNVPLWLEEGMLNTVALHPDITPEVKTNNPYPKKVALAVDEAGNVPAWFEDGKLNAVELHENLTQDLVKSSELLGSVQQTIKQTQISTSGPSLWLGKGKISRLQSGLPSKLKVGFTGDSWTEHKEIPQAFADYLYLQLGKSGEGWIQLNIDNPNLINGVSLSRSGWSIYDASATTANPPYPTSMDGQFIYSAGTDATVSLSNLYATSIRIFYFDGNGTFRYSINGSASVVVTGAGTNSIVGVTVSGLNIATASSLVIDLVGNAGTTVLYGFYAEGSGNGVEINKMGNGGITGPGYTKTLTYLPQTASVVSPDILFIIIATNDYRTNVSLDSFKTSLTAFVSAWKSAVPDAGIVLIAPPQCNASGVIPLSSFRDVMRDVSASLGVEFYSMYDFMNTSWAKSNSLGMWLDSLHLSSAGAKFMFNDINKNFLGV